MRRFEDRVAVVTGAGSGLGQATAMRLAAEGALVGVPRHRGRRGGEDRGRDRGTGRHGQGLRHRRVRSGVGARRGRRRGVGPGPAAARPSTAPASAASRTRTRCRSRTGSASSASTSPARSSCARPRSRTCSTAAVRSSTSRRTPGIKAQPYSAAYCASKAGVVHLTKVPRRRVPEARIRANCVAPGGIDTPLQHEFMHMPEGVDWKAFRKVMSPLGQLDARGDRERRDVRRVRRDAAT